MYIKQNYEIKNGQATLEDFKRWCKKFPNPFQEGENPKYYQSKIDPGYFMSLERVRGVGLFNKYDFVSITIRTLPVWTCPTYTDKENEETANKYFPGALEEYKREIYGE
jgi:hypothetical protein